MNHFSDILAVMNILQIAIDAEGGVGKLAVALGIRQNVVSNWRIRGLPKPWEQLLTLKYQPKSEQSADVASQEGQGA